MLRKELTRHYEGFCNRLFDKSFMPMYLFLSGAGTGKSRNAAEFHQTAISCVAGGDKQLLQRLHNAWVFHTSFENGTSLRSSESVPFRGIGTRMLYQLLPEKMFGEIEQQYDAVTPEAVLQQVAKYEKKDLEQITVILIVDGLQALMASEDDGHNRNSVFYRTLTAIGDLAQCGPFLLPCCTATVSRPVSSCLNGSNRRRVYLPVASLKPPTIRESDMSSPVFESKNGLLGILLDDCGGHGRAIETLWTLIINNHSWEKNIRDFMCELRECLSRTYELAFRYTTEEVRSIVRASFSHKPLWPGEEVLTTGKRPDELASPGLIRYDVEPDRSCGYLHLPYIWLWSMAGRGGQVSRLPRVGSRRLRRTFGCNGPNTALNVFVGGF